MVLERLQSSEMWLGFLASGFGRATACSLMTFAEHVQSVAEARLDHTALVSVPKTVHAGEASRANTHPEHFLEG